MFILNEDFQFESTILRHRLLSDLEAELSDLPEAGCALADEKVCCSFCLLLFLLFLSLFCWAVDFFFACLFALFDCSVFVFCFGILLLFVRGFA